MAVTVQTQELSFAYPGSSFAMQNINFTMQPGEVLALCGPNGSGKTTLGKLLCGLLTPTGGKIFLGGEDSTGWTLGQRGKRIGYLFQEPARQIFAPTVLEDLTFTQELAGVPADQAKEQAMALLSRFELDKLADQSTLTLSRGEQQRLAICGLLLGGPAALVLDEPTTGLDASRKNILAAAIAQCSAHGVAVLLISHDMNFVHTNATRMLRIDRGVLR